MYFILDQDAPPAGVDYFYAAAEPDDDGVLVYSWVTDVLLAALFLTPEDAARAIDELGNRRLLIASLPEPFSSFVVERHNYVATLDALYRRADDFIEQANAFARAIQGPRGAHQGHGGEQ